MHYKCVKCVFKCLYVPYNEYMILVIKSLVTNRIQVTYAPHICVCVWMWMCIDDVNQVENTSNENAINWFVVTWMSSIPMYQWGMNNILMDAKRA